MQEYVRILQRCDAFLGLGDEEIRIIADLPSCHIETYEAGDSIGKEGDVAEKLYIVSDGEIILTMDIIEGAPPTTKTVKIDIITKGSIASWSSLVTPYIYTMSLTSAKATQLLAIDGAELRRLFEQNKDIGYEVMRGLVRVISLRLRDAQRVLARHGCQILA
jgi:CRP-like cAMP-binding protein